MVGCHQFRLIPIPINKKDLAVIKISQISRLWYIIIFPPTGYPYKVRHRKIGLPSILKSTLILPCQGCNYSFLYITKITCQTHHPHEPWQHIWPSCYCCLCHESSACRNLTQISIPCDLISPWKGGRPTTIPPYISSKNNRNISVDWRNRSNKQPHR